MLAAIGVSSIDQLFEEIPEGVRLGRPLDLPAGQAEQEVYDHLAALAAHAAGFGTEVVETPLDDQGTTDLEALAAAVDDDTSAVILQQPNFLGSVEDLGALAEAAKRTGGLLVVAADPLTLGILEPP